MFIGLTWLAWVDMKLVQHYRILGLRRNASFSEVKKAYRQMVRKYHPDVNQDKAAVERFIKINESYTVLCDALQSDSDSETISSSSNQYASVETSTSDRLNLDDLKRKLEKLGIGHFQSTQQTSQPRSAPQQPQSQHEATTEASNHTGEERTSVHISDIQKKQQTQQFANSASISEQDLTLKREAYEQLKVLLRQQKFPRAIALVEGLAQRMPTDLEINQWQAIVYQRWGRQRISQGQFQKARIYLKKALQTDPNNPSLKKEVDRDLGLLKHLQAVEATL